MRTLLAAALILLEVTGCRHAPAESPAAGASSFTVVDARRAPEAAVIVGQVEPSAAKHDQDYRPAVPLRGQPMPVYPEKARQARAGAATVGVRVTVDATGKVTEIGPSILVFSTPGPHAEDFMRAVRDAVWQWKFRPAEILYLEKVESPEASYSRVKRTDRMMAQLDLAFNFTASGGVAVGR